MMKKRYIFCIFFSIYLIYSHKNFIYVQVEEMQFINPFYKKISYLINNKILNLNNQINDEITDLKSSEKKSNILL